MAEAVKPRSRAKAGRGKAKEKKKKEERIITPPLLSSTVKDEEGFQESRVECLSESILDSEAKKRETVCVAPQNVVALDHEGSPATPLSNPPIQMEEPEKALQEEENTGGEGASTLSSLMEAKEASSNLSESRIPYVPSLEGSGQEPETGNIQEDANHAVVSSSEEIPASINVPSKEAKEQVPNSGFKKLYPALPLELFSESLSELSIQTQLPKGGRLYPEIPVEPELVAFTKEQLKVFEPCSWLENVDSYVEEFGSVAQQDRHEFFELLLNYWRCRKQLLLAEAELQTLTSDCKNTKGRLWTFKDEQQSVQGVCADQCKVSGHHRYQTVEVNEGALGDLKRLFEAQAEHVHQTLALHLYTSVLSRLQVESYIYGLLSSSPLLKSLGIQQQTRALKQTEDCSSDLGPLKECISVLFSFTRRVVEDPQFQSDVLSWLQRLVSVLQRVGSPGDHLFLLNHILRCPAGVSKWAVPFIQVNRAEFMCHMKPSERRTSSSSEKESGNWTLVDEGGEEDEDPDTSWILLLEDDLIALLSQFPFHELFQHLLGFDSKEMMKIFAFANSLVELLAVGLETFNRARYRQFVKRIGRLISNMLWKLFFIMHCAENENLEKLCATVQLEDCKRQLKDSRWLHHCDPMKNESENRLCTSIPNSSPKKDSRMVSLLESRENKIFLADYQHLEHETEHISSLSLVDPAHLESFEKYLQGMNGSEEICLLTTFAQMAQTKRDDADEDFVKVIVLEIYEVSKAQFDGCAGFVEVSYVSLSTRETFSKVGRELLGAITAVHTSMISVLLDRVRDTIERVGMSHVYISSQPSGIGPAAVLEFWVQALTSQPLWHKERANLYLMDHLCQAAFQFNQEDCVQKLLYQQYKNALGYHCDKGLLSSLVSWIVAGNITPSFIEGNANPTQIWFAWTILNMESIFEEDSQLRRVVERELVVNSLTPDQALKRAQTQLKLPLVPSLQRLLIYRWAYQALSTPADHPLLPLIWQKFFLLYLHRPGPQYGLPVDGCIGKRFFQSPAHLSLLSDLKQCLIEAADFHHSASKALRVESPAGSSENLVERGSMKPEYLTSPELHKELVRLFNMYVLWLEEESFQKGDTYIPSLPKQYDAHRLAKVMQNQQDLWIEFVNVERIQHEFQEALDLWFQARVESHVALTKERITSSLKIYDVPQASLPLQPMKALVPVISSTSLVSPSEAKELTRANLRILQHHAKSAALRESQQVAFNNEILDTLPKLYTNREEQVIIPLECRGSSGKGCQGASLVTIQFEGKHKNEAVGQQLHGLEKEVKQLQAEATKPPSVSVVEAAVHMENFITALINLYKRQSMPGIHRIGINLFFAVVEFVCDETQRHPPTRQFFTSCIEILGQTILKNRRLCTLLSPYFTPVASPEEFVNLYEKVVAFLGDDNSDFDLPQWLHSSRPSLSERTRLLESIHLALKACGFAPEEDILMPFSIFCKHWTCLLQYQFPDHYSGFLRLLMQNQLLSPDCWKASLKALGCTSVAAQQGSGDEEAKESITLQASVEPFLSADQVMETIEWLSDYFFKLRLSSRDFQSFGLFSKWAPYIAEVNHFMEYLVNRLIDSEVISLSQEPVGSRRVLAALHSLHLVITKLFKPWIEVIEREDASKQPCYPWLESDTPVASDVVQLYAYSIGVLHESFKDKLLPSHHGALWLHLMHYCKSCTAPKMPEHILYTFHILCEVNWVSVLSSAWNPDPPLETHDMIVCLLYMVVLLAKEEQLLTKEESPLLNLLGQTSSLPWQLISILSYENIISYFNSHYPPSIILAKEPAAELIVKLLKASAGFGASSDSHVHLDATLKCRAYIRQVVHFLSILEQSGKITLSALEQEMSKLLDDIVIFNPPDVDLQLCHLAISNLFAEALMLMNSASISTAESLRVSLRGWIDSTVHGLGVMPLLTAACQSLASVRHMAETTEACVTAYFNEDAPLNQDLGWGPIVASLQVPELTSEDFLQECLSLGGYLTLYVYMLQQLNSEQTLVNEMRVLLMLSKWLEQVYPSSAKDEAKLFLWWHKVLQLCLLQVDQEDAVLMESVVRILMSLQGRQNLLAEERLTSGILGAIGLGRRSPLFRVVSRSLSAFLLVQIPVENQIRLRPGVELQLSGKAQQALNALDSLLSNKQYTEYQEQISQASQFIKDSRHSLRDGNNLLAILVNTLYPEVHYLDAIR
ncbi:hypothetical protein JD844_008196 [Phrynosoma platyrhinos]|uniref:Ectopic P granules protein 5 homolog n=1 Tax=Phrynosoma platyrhinos TaxID=52577 RepID=A0ABQ7TDS6_PHRPL|nr:hypothetical protein JD844_008196 [Phrynosoma platyrhinos]